MFPLSCKHNKQTIKIKINKLRKFGGKNLNGKCNVLLSMSSLKMFISFKIKNREMQKAFPTKYLITKQKHP